MVWQIGEMGKIDAGGGGTVAQYMANRNITTIDAGVPVLSMHAPFETVGKLDCYMNYLAARPSIWHKVQINTQNRNRRDLYGSSRFLFH